MDVSALVTGKIRGYNLCREIPSGRRMEMILPESLIPIACVQECGRASALQLDRRNGRPGSPVSKHTGAVDKPHVPAPV